VPEPTAIDRVPFVQARRRALAATAGVVLLAALLVRRTVVLAAGGGDTRFAVIPFLAVGALCVGAWFVLGRMWRRIADLRPLTLPVDAGLGALRGAPEDDPAPGRHLTLGGEIEGPTRW
jgi:hypothetical protein